MKSNFYPTSGLATTYRNNSYLSPWSWQRKCHKLLIHLKSITVSRQWNTQVTHILNIVTFVNGCAIEVSELRHAHTCKDLCRSCWCFRGRFTGWRWLLTGFCCILFLWMTLKFCFWLIKINIPSDISVQIILYFIPFQKWMYYVNNILDYQWVNIRLLQGLLCFNPPFPPQSGMY